MSAANAAVLELGATGDCQSGLVAADHASGDAPDCSDVLDDALGGGVRCRPAASLLSLEAPVRCFA